MTSNRVLKRLRKICLALPGSEEVRIFGRPTFRVGRKEFAQLDDVEERVSITFRVDPLDLPPMLGEDMFRNQCGRGQWYSVWADGRIKWRALEQVLERSYRLVAKRNAR